MRIAVLSDIHANLEALTAALRAAEAKQVDALVCLGDVVGYGPSPVECVDIVRAECEFCVLGNHDAAVATAEDIDVLPRDGQAAARLHRDLLRDDQMDWLAGLPLTIERHGATFVHAAPLHPERWTRLESFHGAREQFKSFSTPICFVGHSHRPAVVSETLGVFRVRPGHRFIVDVGSVGQPRDHDSRLSFAIFDTDAVGIEHVRDHYDHAQTARRIAKVGLPTALGNRLRQGI